MTSKTRVNILLALFALACSFLLLSPGIFGVSSFNDPASKRSADRAQETDDVSVAARRGAGIPAAVNAGTKEIDSRRAQAAADRALIVARAHKNMTCVNVEKLKVIIAKETSVKTEGATASELADRRVWMNALVKQAEYVKLHEDECDGFTSQSEHVFASVYSAALLGDLDSKVCFFSGEYTKEEERFHGKELLPDYLRSATGFGKAAMQQGDWRAVELLLQVAGGSTRHDWFLQLDAPDEIEAYKLLKLLSLGEPDHQKLSDLEKEIEAMRTQIGEAQATRLDALALNEFKMYFQQINPINLHRRNCE